MAGTVFKPTAELKRLYGNRQEDIATKVGLRPLKTLRKHFRKELDLGRIKADVKVGKTFHQLASCGKRTAATMYKEKRKAARQARLMSVTRLVAAPAFVVARDKQLFSFPSGRGAFSALPQPPVPDWSIVQHKEAR
jgi:hypothetical protein